MENEIRDFLNEHGIPYEEQKTFTWLKTRKKKLQYDFYLSEQNLAIECQGIQHFEPVDIFGGEESFKKTIERDRLKKALSEENGIKLIYFSTLNIKFPYDVITDKKTLLNEIKG